MIIKKKRSFTAELAIHSEPLMFSVQSWGQADNV